MTPFFSVGSHSTKVHMNELSEWLLQNVEQEDVLGSNYKGIGQDALTQRSVHISYLNKCITIKDQSNLAAGIDVKVLNCEDSYIYINQAVDCLFISDCSNCTVFCAAVKRVCTVAQCENLSITVASAVLRVGNCVDCTVYSYSHFGAPIIYGDTRNLTIAPHNAGYTDFGELLLRGGINAQVSDFQSRVTAFMSPSLMHVPKQSLTFM